MDSHLLGRIMDETARILKPPPDQSSFTFQPGQLVQIVDAKASEWLGYQAKVRHSYFGGDGKELVVLDAIYHPRPDGGDLSWFLMAAARLAPATSG